MKIFTKTAKWDGEFDSHRSPKTLTEPGRHKRSKNRRRASCRVASSGKKSTSRWW